MQDPNGTLQSRGAAALRAVQFRDARIKLLHEYYLRASPYLLHVVPLEEQRVDLGAHSETLSRQIPRPVWGRGRANHEGFLVVEEAQGVRDAHVQYFHDGSVEIYVGNTTHDYP